MKKILLFGAMVLAVAGCSKDEEKQDFSDRAADQALITSMSLSNNAALMAARLADNRAMATSVGDYARAMLVEQGNALEELRSIVSGEGYRLTDSVGADQQALVDRLNRLEGYSFDTAYLNSQILWQREVQNILQSGSDRAHNLLLRRYAGKYYPYTIEQIQRADSILGTM